MMGPAFAVQGDTVNELQAKIALIRNMILFTDWPKEDKEFKNSIEFKFCTYKDFSTFRRIKQIFANSDLKFKGKTLVLLNADSISQLNACHGALLTQVSNREFGLIIKERKEFGPLLFSSRSGFGQKGVHYNLFLQNQRLGFELNPDALRITGHRPQYQLINFAKVLNRGSR